MKQKKPVIWLLSAYRSDSHAAWSDWLVNTFKEFNWQRLELPGRHFRWRIRGNPLSWLNKLPAETPDLILATSMVDLATLKGLHPRLANVRCIYYFHENQFAYPTSSEQHDSVDPKMVQLYGALAADQLLFNSVYNRDSFVTGIDNLLSKLPDEVPENISQRLLNKSHILPVAIEPVPASDERHSTTSPKIILWNHRWEYDKAPQVFADALMQLANINSHFQLALLGERPLKTPAALQQIEQQLADKIIINQKVSRDEYKKYLAQSAIVVSTSIHEFQGLSILEAVSAGATPLVPDDLCYTEQFTDTFRYPPGDRKALARKLAHWLDSKPAPPCISDWYQENLEDKWFNVLSALRD